MRQIRKWTFPEKEDSRGHKIEILNDIEAGLGDLGALGTKEGKCARSRQWWLERMGGRGGKRGG